MDIDVFRITRPDRRLVSIFPRPLPAAFDFADPAQAILEGTWVKMVNGVVTNVGGAAGTPTDSEMTFPVLTGSGRMDVRQTLQITVAGYTPFEFETTRYNPVGVFAQDDPLTVVADADGRGILDVATAGQIVLGRVVTPPQDDVNGLVGAYIGVVGLTV